MWIAYVCEKQRMPFNNNKKSWAVFYICLSWYGMGYGVTVSKVLSSWCSLCKIIENQDFFGYSRYTSLGISNKNSPFKNACQYMLPNLCNDYTAKTSKNTISNINISGAVSLYMRLCKQLIKKTKKRQQMQSKKKELKDLWDFFK